jgi:hypothetical protein
MRPGRAHLAVIWRAIGWPLVQAMTAAENLPERNDVLLDPNSNGFRCQIPCERLHSVAQAGCNDWINR